MFDSVLVANRGEIAVRIIRACRDLGLRSIAVYSEADRVSSHVLLADEAVLIGPPAASESYLRIDRIIEAAQATNAGAIHPGYGFLAERAPFAHAVENAGLTLIGPRSETIEAMGDKTEARRRMQQAGVPIVPGLVEPVQDAAAALEAAEQLGFPVLLKASAGGGGKGMRVVDEPDGVARAFDAASREALAAFGDGSVYLERYLARPRHIEIQVLGDSHGNVVHLGERECSIQRRHQKLFEEAPSPVIDERERSAMGEAAVRAAKAVDYLGAGTVEFLYEDGEFFFLEMNTRLQVEHPVTELVTGLDLVTLQLRVAAGEALPFLQEDVRFEGHAVECRITSEDPDRGFLPSTGTIMRLEVPGGPGVRWDGGIGEGLTVGLHYDPLLGKLIVHGPDRETALRRLGRALQELVIDGVATSATFHRRLLREPDFRAGRLTIRFLEDHPHLLAPQTEDDAVLRAAAVAAALLHDRRPGSLGDAPAPPTRDGLSAWQRAGWPWQAR